MIRRVFAFLLVSWLLGFAIFMVALGHPREGGHTDAIVVPTGGPGRIDRGLTLMQRHAAKRMLISGVAREVRPIELAVEYHVSPGLFACCVDLGREAVDTRSNGDETARWVREHGYHSVRLVTSSWHMPRARMELTHALGPDVEVIGDPVPSSPSLTFLFGEYNKFLVRRAALWLGID
ncbi:YdcF family protein [Stakelama marina]|uniref:YdcF family protein n=1 Tax=Stakelama marina TaxID=2826939 RepID=A0A8T4IGK1_9SPHN|nr:YdcF family protein [Stakelama marina]MBR0553162.1 YdcF family protein [Stakelama marina]